MYESDRKKISFMTEQENYQYNVIPFGMKIVGVTYPRMMKKMFQEEIEEALEFYMDDMIVKSSNKGLHNQHLDRVFQRE